MDKQYLIQMKYYTDIVQVWKEIESVAKLYKPVLQINNKKVP